MLDSPIFFMKKISTKHIYFMLGPAAGGNFWFYASEIQFAFIFYDLTGFFSDHKKCQNLSFSPLKKIIKKIKSLCDLKKT